MLGRVSYGYAAEIISKYFPWMGRIVHTHNKTSVVVSIVHEHGIFTLEGECQTPVAADIYRPMPLKLAEQGVQSPARRIHVLWRLRIIQRKKLLPQPLGMVRLDFRLRSSPEELLDTLVPEALYHPYSVYYRYTFGQPYVSYLPFLLGTVLFAIILSACKLNSLQSHSLREVR